MIRMAIEGMGIVSAAGNGQDALTQAALGVLGGVPGLSCACKADTGELTRFVQGKALRRVDHFTRMTLLATHLALEDAGLVRDDLDHTGIVLATGYGPVKQTFDFLDSIIDFGPEMASPQAFAHSVHNIPAATVALLTGLRSPCFTICQLDTAVAAAAITACAWLGEGRVQRVLLGAVDEHTDLLEENALRIARDIPPGLSGGRRNTPPGDGAVFFSLHADPSRARHGFFEAASVCRDACIAGAEPVFFSGSASPQRRGKPPLFLDFSAAYGNTPTAMAFDAALATMALRGRLGPGLGANGSIHCMSRDRSGLIGSIRVRRGAGQ